MNANFAKTFSTTFPSIARNTFQSTNYKTNRDSSTGFSPSIKHKGKKKTKRAVSPSSMSISQATTDDTIFATISGKVKFERFGRDRKKVSVYAD